jgi:predicted permease
MELLLGKLIGIFIIILIGYIAAKAGWITQDSTKSLSRILINIASPCLILYTMTHFTAQEGTWVLAGWVLALLAVFYVLCTLAGRLYSRLTRVPEPDRGIYTFSLTYTNNGFLGLPMAQILFGAESEGFFLMIIGNLFGLILFFSAGILTITQNTGHKRTIREFIKPLINVPIFAALSGIALMLLNVKLPVPINETLLILGNMMIPLAMLIVGAQLAGSRIRDVLREKKYYSLTALRLVVIPATVFILLTLFQVPPLATAAVVLTAALPSAALAVVFAEEYNKNTKLAAEIVFVTTLFSVITLPVVMTLISQMF